MPQDNEWVGTPIQKVRNLDDGFGWSNNSPKHEKGLRGMHQAGLR